MKEAQEGSFWWVVIMYIQVVVLYVLSFIVLYTLRKNILTCIDKVMYRFVFWIIYVSTIFYFLNIENNDIFLRWLNVVKIPMIYLLSKYVFNRFTYSCISMTNCFVFVSTLCILVFYQYLYNRCQSYKCKMNFV